MADVPTMCFGCGKVPWRSRAARSTLSAGIDAVHERLDALRVLLGGVSGLPMPPRLYTVDEEESYLAYARRLKKPRVEGMVDLLEKASLPAAKPGLLKRLFS
jgi:hypothetical protein